MDLMASTNVIYQIPCLNCPRTYVGETLQHLIKRIKQHKNDERNHKNDISKSINNGTALAKHARDENHTFNIEKVKILAKESNIRKRKLREVVEILKHKTVNFKTDTMNLRDIW